MEVNNYIITKYRMGTSLRESEDILYDRKKIVPGPGSYNETEHNIKNYGRIPIK